MFQVLNSLQTIARFQVHADQINSPVDVAFPLLLEVMLSGNQQTPQFGNG
jgi:hypothetical protein